MAQQSGDAASLDDVQAEFAEAFDAIGQYTAQERDAALAALDETLGRIDDQIDQLEQRVRDQWAEMSQAARERTSNALRELRTQRNRLSEAYGALGQGAGDAWGDLVTGVRAGWTELELAWDEAFVALGPEPEQGG